MSQTIRMDNGDIDIGSAGEETWIGGAEKAAQDTLDEVLLPYDVSRDRGDELFEPDGSLTSLANSDLVGSAAIKAMIKAAVQRLMRAQTEDSNTDAEEIVQQIKTLMVQNLNTTPTSVAFLLAIVVNDENIALARAIRMGHLGATPFPLVGGFDP